MVKTLKKKTLEELVESLANFTYGRFQKVDERFDRLENLTLTLVKRADTAQDDITDIKRMVTQLVQTQAGRDRFEINTDRRLTKVEKHLKFA